MTAKCKPSSEIKLAVCLTGWVLSISSYVAWSAGVSLISSYAYKKTSEKASATSDLNRMHAQLPSVSLASPHARPAGCGCGEAGNILTDRAPVPRVERLLKGTT